LDAINNHRYVYFGFYADPTPTNVWNAVPAMAYSDNLVDWNSVAYFTEQLGSLRDINVKKIGDYYYVIGTYALYRTTNFVTFEELDLNLGNFDTIWAPEVFTDLTGNSHIIYCANTSSDANFKLYIADLSSDGVVSQPAQPITWNEGQLGNVRNIDPDIYIQDGTYYLTTQGNYIYKSSNYLGPYDRMKVNFAPTPQSYGILNSGISHWIEGPQMFRDGNNVRLFADDSSNDGLVFQSAYQGDLTTWSTRQQTICPEFKMRHGCILVNEAVAPALVDEEIDDEAEFDPIMTIQAHNSDQKIPLTCYEANTFNYQYENNQTNQIQFTAYDDGSPSFSALEIESLITFNGDLFVVKQIQPTLTGVNLPQVTAIQYVNSEISRIFQHNTQTGTLTYTVQDVLNYWLSDSSVNFLGFSYAVHGDFDSQQIQDLGNGSGSDMTSKIIDTWSGTIIRPIGKVIHVYSADAFVKQSQKRIDYLHDTSEIDLAIDSTGVYNQVKCIGATVDTSTTDSDTDDSSDSNTETYYFQPFFVSDQESINNWGLHPMPDLSDDRFTIADNMKACALTQLQADPIITTTITMISNKQPIPGEKARLNIQTMDYSTDVTVVSFTWYPFSKSQQTQISYDNLPASILHQKNNRNTLAELNKIREQLGNIPQLFYGNEDPSTTNTIKNGAIWIKPIEATSEGDG
jgi:hypothetical protein